jgi:hypothetical protein
MRALIVLLWMIVMVADMQNYMNSNLSKIKPKLRTEGRVSGNFGKNKVKAGANNQLGFTSVDTIKVVTQDEYLNRMYEAFNKTDDPKLKQFCFTQIRNILIQRGAWK